MARYIATINMYVVVSLLPLVGGDFHDFEQYCSARWGKGAVKNRRGKGVNAYYVANYLFDRGKERGIVRQVDPTEWLADRRRKREK